MMTEWYWDRLGTVEGPLSGPELLRLVRNGEITAITPVRRGDSKWYMAEQINGLFEAAFGKPKIPEYSEDY